MRTTVIFSWFATVVQHIFAWSMSGYATTSTPESLLYGTPKLKRKIKLIHFLHSVVFLLRDINVKINQLKNWKTK